ncbi:MAG: phosphoribosyltransferase family protein, partial [Bacillus sp. (in: Bacteria)]|nr:phosphoribosyltransferase family protein [Bacillus sp. (in: firmicutes)]
YVESVKGLNCPEKEVLLSYFKKGESYQSLPFVSKEVNPVVIGFAETATALGQSFFDCFTSAAYFHTTREVVSGKNPEITFEEEHSHATSHRCYIPLEMIRNEREIILVDDEMTTGKTALNIINSIHEKFPRQMYTVVSILDWRSKEDQKSFYRLEQILGIKINVVSLLSGNVEVKQMRDMKAGATENIECKSVEMPVEHVQLASFFSATPFSTLNKLEKIPFIEETGRFGRLSSENNLLHQKVSEAAAFLKEKRTGKTTLCLGTGEFMYLPMKLAAEMGSGVYYQSTTRSPIYIENQEGYGARYGITFPNPEDPTISHFVYNIPPGHYDELFIFFERKVKVENLRPLLKELKTLQIKSIKLVFFSEYPR